LHDDDIFKKNMINYLNGIITWDMNQYKSCPIMTNKNYIDDNLDNICTTMPLDPKRKSFTKLFQNDIHKLMNICNWHVCNPTCYKTNANT
jgi:hypothetical protein